MQHKNLLAISLLLFLNQLTAQNNTDSSNNKTIKKSYFQVFANYLSNAVFFGRKDSVRVPYITPSIAYYNKSGFFVNASASYLNSQQNSRVDLVTIGTGYNFSVTDNLLGGIYADKYFYNNLSYNVRSDLSGAAGAYLYYDPGIIGITGGVDLLFAQKTDATANLGIFYTLNIDEKEKWNLSPALTAFAGTQNFYSGFANRSSRGRRGNIAPANLSQSSRFAILAYELSLPLNYDGDKWGISFTPVYAIPVNPITFKNNVTGNTIKLENLQNSFYAELSVYIKF